MSCCYLKSSNGFCAHLKPKLLTVTCKSSNGVTPLWFLDVVIYPPFPFSVSQVSFSRHCQEVCAWNTHHPDFPRVQCQPHLLKEAFPDYPTSKLLHVQSLTLALFILLSHSLLCFLVFILIFSSWELATFLNFIHKATVKHKYLLNELTSYLGFKDCIWFCVFLVN